MSLKNGELAFLTKDRATSRRLKFDLVQIHVPNKKATKALELLESFDEFQPNKDE